MEARRWRLISVAHLYLILAAAAVAVTMVPDLVVVARVTAGSQTLPGTAGQQTVAAVQVVSVVPHIPAKVAGQAVL